VPSFVAHPAAGLNLFSDFWPDSLPQLTAFTDMLHWNRISKLQLHATFATAVVISVRSLAQTLRLSDDLMLVGMAAKLALPRVDFYAESDVMIQLGRNGKSHSGNITFTTTGIFQGSTFALDGCLNGWKSKNLPIGDLPIPLLDSCIHITWRASSQRNADATNLLTCSGNMSIGIGNYKVPMQLQCGTGRLRIAGNAGDLSLCAVNNGGCDQRTQYCQQNYTTGAVVCRLNPPCYINNGGCGDPLLYNCQQVTSNKNVSCTRNDLCSALKEYCGPSEQFACVSASLGSNQWPICIGRRVILQLNVQQGGFANVTLLNTTSSGNSTANKTALVTTRSNGECPSVDLEALQAATLNFLRKQTTLPSSAARMGITYEGCVISISIDLSNESASAIYTLRQVLSRNETLTAFSSAIRLLLVKLTTTFLPTDRCGHSNGDCGPGSYCQNYGEGVSCAAIPTCNFGNGGCGAPQYITCVQNSDGTSRCSRKDAFLTLESIDTVCILLMMEN
jgi:hypothetical protein